MNQYVFDATARRILDAATADAQQRQHEYIGTEHLLSAVLNDPAGPAALILQQLQVDLAELQRKLDATIPKGKSREAGVVLPYTSRARHVLELAIEEARSYQEVDVGAQHLLIGLLAEGRGIGAQMLALAACP